MNLITQVTLPGQIHASAISPGGEYAVAAVEGDRLVLLDGEDLTPPGTLALPSGNDHLAPGTTVRPLETRIVFLDGQTLLVARSDYVFEPEGSEVLTSPTRTRLLALDSRTGDVRGEFQLVASVLRTDPVPIPPHHVLLSYNGLSLVCVDASSWREAGRVGEREEDHDPDSAIEEEIANNGVAYDPHGGLVHVLWRYFNAGVVQSYRFDPEASRFVNVRRGPVVEGDDAGIEANGLCVRPDGSAVAAWFTIADAMVGPDEGGPLGSRRMARLGRLGLFSPEGTRFLDVRTEMARDLLVSPTVTHDDEGREVHLGDRVGVDFFEFRPVFLDGRRVLLNTPGGFLLGVDTEGGRTEVLGDFRSPILSLGFHRAKRLLLVCCEDRSAHLMRL
jgi:hypothetical protein